MKPKRALPENWAASFRTRFVERLEQVLVLIRAWTADSGDQQLEELHTAIHNLVGVAGALGYAEISDCARLVDVAINERGRPDPEQLDALARVMERERAR